MIRKRLVGLQVVLFVATCMGLAMSRPVIAGVVVNWGGNYISGSNGPVNFGGEVPANIGQFDSYGDPSLAAAYSNSSNPARSWTISGQRLSVSPEGPLAGPPSTTSYSPRNPPSSGYSGSSDRFYGGHAVVMSEDSSTIITNSKNFGATTLRVVNQGPNDWMHVEVEPKGGGDAPILEDFAMLTYWSKYDFLDGASNKIVKLNGDSEFFLDASQDAQGSGQYHKLRWVIRDDNKFWVTAAVQFNNNTSFTESSPDSILWREYGVERDQTSTALASIFAGIDPSLTTQGLWRLGSSFTSITAVGFYIEYDRTLDKNGANFAHYKISNFKATLDPNGNAVPEPGTFLLGLVGFGGVAARRWQQRRKAAAAKSEIAAVVS